MNHADRFSRQPLHNGPRNNSENSWSIIAAAYPRPSRSRLLRRRLRGYGPDLAWAALMLVVLTWMILIALTLWH